MNASAIIAIIACTITLCTVIVGAVVKLAGRMASVETKIDDVKSDVATLGGLKERVTRLEAIEYRVTRLERMADDSMTPVYGNPILRSPK